MAHQASLSFKNMSLIIMFGAAGFYLQHMNKPVYRVQRLVDAARDEPKPSRRLVTWQQAVEVSKEAPFTPKIKFGLNFQLATHHLEFDDKENAEVAFLDALSAFPPGFDLHSLPPSIRYRVAVCLDNLAQFHQDRKEYAKAMEFYDRALDALCSPQEVYALLDSSTKPEESRMELKHVEGLAGILNNISTLYAEIGSEEKARDVFKTSERCMKILPQSSVEDPH